MLTSFDDYPIHQTSQPVALTATSDPNAYDRYFFNGYTRSGDLFFAAALGIYPNRHVADAAFSVVRNGEQVNVHASRRAPLDRLAAMTVGPIEVQVIEPLQRLRVLLDAPEHGVRADLLFTVRTAPVQEAPFLRRAGQRVWFDYTRLTQCGAWDGWVEVDGTRIDVAAATTWGSRDRSWGIRPVGERVPTGAPATEPPQFYWLWSPVNFERVCTYFDVNETSDGTRWHHEASIVPVGAGEAVHAQQFTYDLEWRSDSRHAERFELQLTHASGTSTLSLQPRLDFQMKGIGYGHPEWSHGVWKGELAVGGDRWSVPVQDPLGLDHLHIQALCDATLTSPDGDVQHGQGILEQLVIGPHAPTGLTGLTGLTDGA